MIARLVNAFRRDGVGLFTRRFAALARRVAGYQRLVVYRHATPAQPVTPESVREVSVPAAREIANLPWDHATLDARHLEGARLFSVCRGGDHTSFGWVTDGPSMWVDETSCRITSRQPRIWIWDCVTPAQFRGQGQYPELLQGILRQLGHSRAVIYCRAENSASRRGIEKAGFTEGESVIRLGGLLWVWSRGGTDPVAATRDRAAR